jgi:glycerate-2-kinase
VLFRNPQATLLAGSEPESRRAVSAILQEAVKGADAYLAVRRAVRREEGALRVGNLFVPEEALGEVAFVAVGNCAAPMAQALHDALGEQLTQGFVAGPMPPPPPWPFLYYPVVDPVLPTPEGMGVADHALELAGSLGERDLFIPLLSPGGLGMLGSPPPGVPLEEYRETLETVAAGPAGPSLLPLAAALWGRAQGGRLARAAARARVEALLIEYGQGGGPVAGMPTLTVAETSRERLREGLLAQGLLSRLPRPLTEAFRGPPLSPPPRTHSVVIAGPTDALEAAGEEASDHRHRPRLLGVHDPSPPREAAQNLTGAVEEFAPLLPSKPGEGIALFQGLGLGRPEGGITREDLADFLEEAHRTLLRRNALVAILLTSGSLGDRTRPSGGIIGAQTPFDRREFLRGGTGALDLRPGFSDVGAVAVAYLTR